MDQKTIESYDRTAEGYARGTDDYWARTPQPSFIQAFIKALSGRRVLDVGSGTGRDGLIFRRHWLEPICYDASAAMVKMSSERGLPSMLGDFAKLPFRDAEFDGVWAYTSLLHVPKAEIDGPLAEIRRVLKQGGVFGLGLLEGQGEEHKDLKGDGNSRLFSYYSADEAHDALARNGLRLMHSSRILPGTMPHLHFLARNL